MRAVCVHVMWVRVVCVRAWPAYFVPAPTPVPVHATCDRTPPHRFRYPGAGPSQLGENLTDDELQAMIDEFDRDHDGLINESEFASIRKQTSLY